MNRSDITLLSESYQEVKLKNYISQLFEEGNSEKQIVTILTEAGLWDRVKSRWGAYSPFEKENRENIASSLKGGAARLAKKGLEKFGDVTDTDYTKDNVYKKLHDISDSGHESESAIRSKKYASLVQRHKQDINDVFTNTIKSNESNLREIDLIVDNIVNDYERMGGIPDIKGMREHLRKLANHLYYKMIHVSDAEYSSNVLVDKLVEYINKQKTHGEKALGLRKAHKLKPAQAYTVSGD